MKKLMTTLVVGLIAFQINAQKTLPYFNGFDTPSEQLEWTEERLGIDLFYNWGFYGTTNVVLYHDYPVGVSNTDTTYDWMISPALDLSAGGSIALYVKAFTMVGIMEVDYFGIWACGSNMPIIENFTEVADLTDFYENGSYKDTSGIDLGVVAPIGYVALVYRATNNWYTVEVDSVKITANTSGIEENDSKDHLSMYTYLEGNSLKVMTNSCQGKVNFSIYDLSGKELRKGILHNEVSFLDVSALNSGIYFIKLENSGRYISEKWMKY